MVRRAEARTSPRERGYGSQWDRLSLAYRRAHPFCEWCSQVGMDGLTAVADHMIPVVDRPDLLLSHENIWSLCDHHHGRKYAMEEYARQTGQIEKLPEWCRDPEKRPARFR